MDCLLMLTEHVNTSGSQTFTVSRGKLLGHYSAEVLDIVLDDIEQLHLLTEHLRLVIFELQTFSLGLTSKFLEYQSVLGSIHILFAILAVVDVSNNVCGIVVLLPYFFF